MLARYGNAVEQAAQKLLADNISKITLDSAFLPPVVIDHPFASDPSDVSGSSDSTFGDKFLDNAKLQFTVYTTWGPWRIAPWGAPPETTAWPLVEAGLLLAGVLAIYGAYKLVR